MRVLPFGDRALLIEVDAQARSGRAVDAVLALRARLAAGRLPGVVDIVPAARTILVRTRPGALSDVRAGIERIGTQETTDATPEPAAEIELPIVYDGADLADTAQLLEMSVEALVRRHAWTMWTVAFTGFAPGFGYLIGDDWPFDVPRLPTPRTRVPAGAVGLAAEFCGAYPRATPGGWRLIGTTGAPLFDAAAADPALLIPGARVRFVERAAAPAAAPPAVPLSAPAAAAAAGPASASAPTGAAPTAPPAPTAAGASAPAAPTAAGASAPAAPAQNSSNPGGEGSNPAARGGHDGEVEEFCTRAAGDLAFEVVEPGLLTTVQDLGRPGRASQGIAISGAFDRAALRAANRLVGNRENAAGLEITMGGLRALARRDVWIAVTGGWGPIRIGGHQIDPYEAVQWPAGTELHVDWLVQGARVYLAVRGGIDARAVAGSRATDTMAGLGPAPLRAGDALRTGDAASAPIPPAEPVMGVPPSDEIVLTVSEGPRADWFTATGRAALFDAVWTVADRADRVGIRLDGPGLERARFGELPSEGMVPGAIQVPPAGRPVILGADGPVTGGYPVIAVVTDAALDRLAQARPGSPVRFRHARPV